MASLKKSAAFVASVGAIALTFGVSFALFGASADDAPRGASPSPTATAKDGHERLTCLPGYRETATRLTPGPGVLDSKKFPPTVKAAIAAYVRDMPGPDSVIRDDAFRVVSTSSNGRTLAGRDESGHESVVVLTRGTKGGWLVVETQVCVPDNSNKTKNGE